MQYVILQLKTDKVKCIECKKNQGAYFCKDLKTVLLTSE